MFREGREHRDFHRLRADSDLNLPARRRCGLRREEETELQSAAIVEAGAPRRQRRRRSNMATLNSNIPSGPLAQKWEKHKFDTKLINPANKRKYKIIVVGAGLAGASAAATLGGTGLRGSQLRVPRFARAARTRSPRRAASTPRRITRTTATPCTGCSTTRSRAATSARAKRTCIGWPKCRVNIIDQCVAQGVPFAREYGGLLDNRSFGGAQVSPHVLRARPDRPATVARRVFRALPR